VRKAKIYLLLIAAALAFAGAAIAEETPDIGALVAQLASEKYYEREAALSALIENAEKATSAMLGALESGDYNTRVAAVKFFDATATPETCPQLFEILKRSKETEVITGLTRVLSRAGYKDSIEHVRTLLADPNPAVRAVATDSLTAFGDRESAGKIAPMLSDEFSEARIAAARALAAMGAADFGKDVFAAFEKEKIPEVQRAMVEAMGELRVADAAPALIEAVKDEESPIFLPAVFALAKIGGDDARDALINLLMTSKDLEMLNLAAGAVGVMGEEAIPALEAKLPELKDDNDARFKILTAFGKMGKCVIPYLISFIENEPYAIWRGQAGDKLRAIIKREYGEDIAVPAYDDSDEVVKEKIAKLKQWWEEHKDK
jgi:HEAT repeat protein